MKFLFITLMIANAVSSQVNFSKIYQGTEPGFSGISFPTPKTGYVFGGNGLVMKTIDAGGNWSRIREPDNTNLWRGAFTDENSGFLVGGMWSSSILRTQDGGQTWTAIKSKCPDWYTSVSFSNQKIGYILGTNRSFMRTVDGGEAWVCQDLHNVREANGMVFTSPDVGYVTADSGKILKTTDGANSWKVVRGPTSKWLFAISFYGPEIGYAVGERGAILKTVDAGENWLLQSGTNNGLRDVKVFTKDIAVAVGDFGFLYTLNGGTNWIELLVAGQGFLNITMVDSGLGYVATDNASIFRISISEKNLSITTKSNLKWDSRSGLQFGFSERRFSINGRLLTGKPGHF